MFVSDLFRIHSKFFVSEMRDGKKRDDCQRMITEAFPMLWHETSGNLGRRAFGCISMSLNDNKIYFDQMPAIDVCIWFQLLHKELVL